MSGFKTESVSSPPILLKTFALKFYTPIISTQIICNINILLFVAVGVITGTYISSK